MWCTHAGGTFTQTHSRANSLLAQHPVDRLTDTFQAVALGADAHEHLGRADQDVLEERQHAAGLQQLRVRLQDVRAHLGREVVQRQAGDHQIELPFLTERPELLQPILL